MYPSVQLLSANKIINKNIEPGTGGSCNPSYRGGRDQEDRSSKPAWANILRDPISKKTHH
jgi:hypothetical protein